MTPKRNFCGISVSQAAMRGGIAAALACTALLACAAAGPAAAGRLDPGYGRGGKLVIPLPKEAEGAKFEMERTREGRIVAIAGHTIVQLLPNGRLNRRFGDGGRLTIRPAEDVDFSFGGIAVDSQGRIVVAGTSSAGGSRATITRYLPSGDLDPSFGAEGTVNTDFGLPRPPSETDPPARVSVTGLAVDAQDRPVLTGASTDRIEWCYLGSYRHLTSGYVARLTPGGSPDPSFHITGVLTDANQQWAELPLPRNGRGIAYFGIENEQCGHGAARRSTLTNVDESGGSSQTLGEAGYFDGGPFGTPLQLTHDRHQRILLFGYPWRPSHQAPDTPPYQVTRFSPTGALDSGFGNGGAVSVEPPTRSTSLSFAVDRRGRPLLVGPRKIGDRLATGLWLSRRTVAGKIDRAFGERGSATIAFGRRLHARSGIVLDGGRERLLVGAAVSSTRLPTGFGLAFARYLGGR